MEKVLIFKVILSNLTVTGKKTSNTVSESKFIKINPNMKVITLKVRKVAEVSTHGKMDPSMMVNGKIILTTVTECTLLQTIIELVEHGKMEKCLATESIYIMTVKSMKENSNKI